MVLVLSIMEDLRINDEIVIPGSELEIGASRSGGPGGQHANKVSSRVTLSWSVATTNALQPWLRARVMRRLASRITRDGILMVHVEDHRSQHRNREVARERLAALIRGALAPRKRRVPTRPSGAARRRRLADKRHRAAIKQRRRRPGESD
jgi:ribosome-associated protein